MDLRALMQKLETINTTHTLTESVEERVVITESVAAPLVQEDTFKSSIARSLIEDFGYSLTEAPNDPNNTAAQAGQQKAMQDARAKKDGTTNYTSGLNPASGAQGIKAPPGAAANLGKPAVAPAATTPDNSNVPTDDIEFDPTWGGTKAAPDKRTGLQKFLPNFLGGQDAPTAANKDATWDNAQQRAVSNTGAGKAPVDPAAAAPAAPAAAPAAPAAAPAAAAPAASTADPKQVARLKELLAKAKGAPATAPAVPGVKAGGGVVDTRGGIGGEEEMEESVHTYFSTDPLLERLRAIEALPLMEALTADEYKELQKIASSLQVDNPQDAELQALTKQALELPAQFAADTPAAPDAPAKPAAPAAPTKPGTKPGADGAVGQDLAKMGVSKQNRLDQAFVDKTLGAGKYKAGSAEANLALQAFMKKQGGAPAAAAPATAAPAASLGGKSFKDASAAANAATPATAAVPAVGVAVGNKPDGVAGQRPTMANDPRLAGAPAAPASPQQQATDDAIYKQAKAAGATGSTSTQKVTGTAAVDAMRAKMGMPPQRTVTPPNAAQMAKMPESVQSSDDQILAMIRDIRIN